MSDGAITGQIWRDGAPVDGFDLAVISDCLTESHTLVWADLEDPSEETMGRLAEELDLSPWAVEDALAAAERTKATTYAHHTFVTVYAVRCSADAGVRASDTPVGASQSIATQRISVFIKRNALITVRLTRSADIVDMAEVRRRWDETEAHDRGVEALLHGLLDVVVDGHFEAVQTLDDAIEDLEGLLFDESVLARTLQRRTYGVRKDLVALRRVVLPMREVVAVIQHRRDALGAGDRLDPEFADLYDHVLRAAEWTESLRDMVSTVFETNLSLQDARLNTVMKKLTGWAAIIAVPTAITGFYGQNVPFPGFDHTVGFVTSCVLLLTAMIVLYALFKRRDWL
ncbi:magnesium transporter CorA family protein [uncultured Williamsia sp.]|uniref:magnesium transporter CorA family protein n=1 Tax=uncultured Williamsia sp. TaxID=259311 RepID=UPI00260386A7|nr:magnesium transporter CorA family protein [uncultured Williamsia sp.]